MRLTSIEPAPSIKKWIHHLWVFESERGLPAGDLRVVVPNGRPKLIVPFRNGLTASASTVNQHHRESDAVVIGLWEEPSIISSSEAHTVTLGVEFKPHGLRAFFPADAHELSQRIISLDIFLGRLGSELKRRLSSADSTEEGVRLLQAFLVERAQSVGPSSSSQTIESAMHLLQSGAFEMDVGLLERKMGYSRRYLHTLFLRHVGIPPKRLLGVLAFEQLYRRFSQNKSANLLRNDALGVFYDQSHFIRTFRRFTGFSPGKFAELDNEFGRIFYRPGPAGALVPRH
jgi:AraC-like DNA-binding protein